MSGSLTTLDLRGEPDLDLSRVIAHLRAGGVVAYPTETVYGLGAMCTVEGVAKVNELKGERGGKPLIALVENVGSVADLLWTETARELASIFWPGAVTLVLKDPNRIFPAGIRDAVSGTVGIRITPHPIAARLVSELGAPVSSTSLNAPGEPPAVSGDEARAVLDRLGGDDVVVLNGGTLPPSAPSTIVDCTGSEPVVLREGVVPIGRLRCVIPETHGQSTE